MKNYLGLIVSQVQKVLGPLWSFVPAILGTVSQALKSGDVQKVLAVAQEIEDRAREEREHADAMDSLAQMLREAVSDGKLTAAELTEVAAQVQTVIDEAEDIVAGHDEDDAAPPV